MKKISNVERARTEDFEFNTTASALLRENNITVNSNEDFKRLFPDVAGNTLSYLEMMEELKGTSEFVERINKLINAYTLDMNKDIGVLGDYDVDGIMGSVILMTMFHDIGFRPIQYAPNRLTDGYGLAKKLAESERALKAPLLVTVDTGIAEKEVISLLQNMGQHNIIVTDHHLPEEGNVPENVLIIDPKYNKDNFQDICGACVALKLANAVYKVHNMHTPRVLVAFAGIATIADMMPMLGENRVLVKETLSIINELKAAGGYTTELYALSQLLRNLGGKKFLETPGELATTDLISFFIAPSINAVSRVEGDVNKLIREIYNSVVYQYSYKNLTSVNIIRKNRTIDLMKKYKVENESESQIVLYDKKDFEYPIQGLIGIVANKISNTNGKVSLVGYSKKDGEFDFSGRGIPGYNLYDGIMRISKNNPELNITGGGHSSAMGIHLHTDSAGLEKFKSLLNEDIISNKIPVEKNIYEFEESIEEEIISTLRLFAPYGQNFKPITFRYTGEFKKYESTNAEIGDFNFRYFATKEEQKLVGSEITIDFNVSFENESSVVFKCFKGGE